MFSDEKFVDLRLAIGEMVINGIQPKVSFVESNGGRSKSCCLFDSATGKQITFVFRDGTRFRVKTETIQDYIDDFELATLKLVKV